MTPLKTKLLSSIFYKQRWISWPEHEENQVQNRLKTSFFPHFCCQSKFSLFFLSLRRLFSHSSLNTAVNKYNAHLFRRHDRPRHRPRRRGTRNTYYQNYMGLLIQVKSMTQVSICFSLRKLLLPGLSCYIMEKIWVGPRRPNSGHPSILI